MAAHRVLGHRSHNLTGRGILILLLALAASSLVYMAEAAPQQQAAPDGKAIFEAKCQGCHTIGGGQIVGPDLKGIGEKRDRQWLVRFTAEPDKMLAENDPLALQLLKEWRNMPMPNMGLSTAEAEAVVDFLAGPVSKNGQAAPTGGAKAPATQPAAQATVQPALPPGDPAIGKALFEGSLRFANGGAPCIGCHEVAGSGALAGGSLGPDLTQASDKYGEAGLASVLAASPFPSMQPIYQNQPLAPAEQAHLKAFLQAPVAPPAADPVGTLMVLAGAGFVLLRVLARTVWRGRLGAVRAPMVETTTRTGGL